MPSFESIDVQHLVGVTGGRMRGGMCPPGGGYQQQHGFSYAYNWHFGGQQQQQVAAAPTPAPRGPRDVLVQTASGPGAQAPAGMMDA